ncbi:MAG: dipeptide epimerase [Armatimonadetes bacterium]|nr:dipeptide epimerase [Armatimonadota bacterium]MDE2206061.1 dipeptide epimerase [Armatimonadota bacterium]
MLQSDATIVTSITAAPLETPLHRPFTTARGSRSAAAAVRVTITLRCGQTGVGESTPVEYVTGETPESVLLAVETCAPALIGLDIRRYNQMFRAIAAAAPNSPSARCGMEMAVLDGLCLARGEPLQTLLGGALTRVETDVTIPICGESRELAGHASELGMRRLKVKLSGDADADLRRLAEIRSAAPDCRLRVDANQAFSVDGALAFVNRLAATGISTEFFEQPTPKEDLDGLAHVAAHSPIPVFADESCQTPEQALRIVSTTEVAGLNLKANKCGIDGLLQIIPIARAADRKIMMGCMLETRRSIAVSLAIVLGTGAFDYVDLDSHMLVNENGPNPCFRQIGGWLEFADGCGPELSTAGGNDAPM